MKNIGLLVAIILVMAHTALAEGVSDVYFNPSRLGSYEVLKVTDALKVEGNLETKAMKVNISQLGQVIMSAKNSNGVYPYQFTSAVPKLEPGVYAEDGFVWMLPTTFNTQKVKLHGGYAYFQGTGTTSKIATITRSNNNNPIDGSLEANGFNFSNKNITITGNNPHLLYDNSSLKGLKLGGHVVQLDSIPCNPNSSGVNLRWVERTADSGNGTSTVSVLGLINCGN